MNTSLASTIDRGRGVCMLRLAHCRVGDCDVRVGDRVGDCFDGEVARSLTLRIVEGVWIVFFRIDVGWGLFGDRMARGSGLSIILVVSDSVTLV
jgi:hypothetical protein